MKKIFHISMALLLMITIFASCNRGNDMHKAPEKGSSLLKEPNDTVETSDSNQQTTLGLQYALNSDNTSYRVINSQTITDTKIVIPEQHQGLPVTSIDDGAFYGCTRLESITLPNSITYIGNEAFYCCTSLLSVTLPDSVTRIGAKAFENCTSLVYNIYNNGYYLGNDSNKYVALIEAISNDITFCEIHSNTKLIGDDAFRACRDLESVTFGENSQLEIIGSCAFYNCSSLTSIIIPDSITRIDISAFYQCTRLVYNTYNNAYYLGNNTNKYVALIKATNKDISSCEIHSDAKLIYHYAFENCRNLESVTFRENSQLKSVGGCAFNGCITLANITIPDGVSTIGSYLFSGCTSLLNIIIPDSVTIIGSEAFYGCASLANIIFTGTKSEWASISKGDGWNNKTGTYTIYCADGDVSKFS